MAHGGAGEYVQHHARAGWRVLGELGQHGLHLCGLQVHEDALAHQQHGLRGVVPLGQAQALPPAGLRQPVLQGGRRLPPLQAAIVGQRTGKPPGWVRWMRWMRWAEGPAALRGVGQDLMTREDGWRPMSHRSANDCQKQYSYMTKVMKTFRRGHQAARAHTVS